MHARLSATLLLVALLLAGTADAGLTDKQQKQILKLHNKARRRVSPTASNMMKLSWDEDLARLAQGWADECSIIHNPDRTIEGRQGKAGENIAASSDGNLVQLVLGWEGEKEVYTYSDNSCNPVPGNPMLAACGHYTQMVWAESTLVGCGFRTDCPGMMKYFLVCNYSPAGNFEGEKPYETGGKCKSCPDGYEGCQKGLCVAR